MMIKKFSESIDNGPYNLDNIIDNETLLDIFQEVVDMGSDIEIDIENVYSDYDKKNYTSIKSYKNNTYAKIINININNIDDYKVIKGGNVRLFKLDIFNVFSKCMEVCSRKVSSYGDEYSVNFGISYKVNGYTLHVLIDSPIEVKINKKTLPYALGKVIGRLLHSKYSDTKKIDDNVISFHCTNKEIAKDIAKDFTEFFINREIGRTTFNADKRAIRDLNSIYSKMLDNGYIVITSLGDNGDVIFTIDEI